MQTKIENQELGSLVATATLAWAKKLSKDKSEEKTLLLLVSGCEIIEVDREITLSESIKINNLSGEVVIPIHLESFKRKTEAQQIDYLKGYFLESTMRTFIKSQETKKRP